MEIKGWRYYNHAAIPTSPPHEEPNLLPIQDKSIWKMRGTPLFARWITDFDCGYETNWWYIVKNAPFDVAELNKSDRKHIRQAMKKVDVRCIDMREYADALSVVHNNACRGYKNFTGKLSTKETFSHPQKNQECWGIFERETERLIGYMICRIHDQYVDTVTAKYDPAFLKLRGSDAVHYTILNKYLNEEHFKYICSGSRVVNHVTNVQDYKISTFGFRKAYCCLHVIYNPKIKWIIKLLFPFRKIINCFDSIGVIHQLGSIMKMEEICRHRG